MDVVGLLFLIIFLVAVGVGGYFVYTKLYIPKQCTGQLATSNVATFMYDSTNGCVANTCIIGYGSGSTATTAGTPPCTQYVASTYTYPIVVGTIGSRVEYDCPGASGVDGTGSYCQFKNKTDAENYCNIDANSCAGYSQMPTGANSNYQVISMAQLNPVPDPNWNWYPKTLVK